MSMLKKIWQGWKRIAHAIGTINGYIVLSLFYFIIIFFTSAIRFVLRLFHARRPTPETFWRVYQNPSGADYKRQF